MAEINVKITYETLFEVLRREKNREELQELDPNFFNDVAEYIQKKKEIINQQEATLNVFSTNEKEKAVLQLNNIKKILKELYNRREKKIISMALNKTRTNSDIIDTSALSAQEEKLFSNLVELLHQHRMKLLFSMLETDSGLAKETDTGNSLVLGSQDNKAEYEKQEEMAAQPTIEDKPKELKTTANSGEDTAGSTKIQFLDAVNRFVGPDLEIYGPYNKEDTALLPQKIAFILISQGKAEPFKGEEQPINA